MTGTRTIHIRYYAMLREERGVAAEAVQTAAPTAGALYDELKAAHGLKWPIGRLKVAVNDELKAWDTALREDDIVSFLPPVAGG
jgi:sulfur-carrier protein